MNPKKKETGMRKRMQSFYFEFLNEDGTVKEVITDSFEGVNQPAPEGKPKKKPQD